MIAESHLQLAQMRYWATGCNCCGAPKEKIRLTNEQNMYGKKYSKYDHAYIWLCTECRAYVGCHQDTTQPKGTLATKEMRKARQKAHHWFDTIWRYYVYTGWTKHKARGTSYRWLSEQLGINIVDCHIGMMDVAQANQVAKICEEVVMDSRILKSFYIQKVKK